MGISGSISRRTGAAQRWVCGVALALLLIVPTACTLNNPSTPAVPVHEHFLATLVETQQSQAAALALWDRVIFGETVSCQHFFAVPDFLTFSERDLRIHPHAPAIQTQLNAAIQSIRNSADLWNIECADARPLVPLSMAKEGRATALAATAPLNEAASLLAVWP